MKKFFLAIIVALSTIAASTAAMATELYISTESTEKYDEYEELVSEYFSEIDEYRELNDFNIIGEYSFETDGMNLGSEAANAKVMLNDNVTSDYVFNIAYQIPDSEKSRIYWSFKDEGNYAYLKYSNGTFKLVNVENNIEKTIAENGFEITENSLTEVRFEVNGENVTVFITVDNTTAEVFAGIKTNVKGGRTGIEFYNTPAKLKLAELWCKREVTYNNDINGYVVSYENLGECTFITAFYNAGILDSMYSNNINVTDCGNNYFSVKIENTHSLQGLDRRFFLFDKLNNLIPVVPVSGIGSYNDEGFSNELEPYYSHPTAKSRSTADMVKRIRGGKAPDADIADEDLTESELPGGERYEVVDMYRKAGIDLSLALDSYLSPSSLVNNIPQRFSRLTPKSLTGDYSQPYSVDAPWNNKIPEDNPSMELGSWNDMQMTLQLATVKTKNDDRGNGIGIPYIIGDDDDPEYSLMCKYGTNSSSHAHVIKAPAALDNYTNFQAVSDNHAIFINGESKTSTQSMGIRVPGYAGGYNITNGLLLNFDARASAVSREIDLTGIVSENSAGTNAVSLPMEAFTIKKCELAEGGEINHAMGAALGNMMKARAYPAQSFDNWVKNATNTTNLTGNIPYGGVVRLSKDLPLEELYKAGKLSSPGYKFLKAWRDYGIYNIDCSGSSHNKILLYTSTEYGDWDYPVPYTNSNGATAVEAEVAAFLAGNEFFGLDRKPEMYLTIPVARYTEFDVTLDGVVNTDDLEAISDKTGKKPSLTDKRFDITKDGSINQNDIDILTSYLSEEEYHKDDTFTIGAGYSTGGRILIDCKTPNKGEWVNISAAPNNGYRFAGWVGEFEDVKENVVHLKADRNYSVKAKFEKTEACKFDLEIIGEGVVKTSSDDKSFNTAVKEEYNANTLLSFLATPAEGWEFSHWEGDINSLLAQIPVVINSDMKLCAVFKQPDRFENFDGTELNENLSAFSSNANQTQDFSLSGGLLKFTDWGERYAGVVDNSVVLNEGDSFEFSTFCRFTGNPTAAGNLGMVVFGFKPEKNYTFYSVEFNKNNEFKFQKQTKGSVSKLLSVTVPETFDTHQMMTISIKYSPDAGISIYLYQNGNSYTIAENYNPGEPVTGQFGVGSRYCGVVGFDKFIIYKESGSN